MLCQGNPPTPTPPSLLLPLLLSSSLTLSFVPCLLSSDSPSLVFIHSFNSLSRLASSRSSCPRRAALAEGSPLPLRAPAAHQNRLTLHSLPACLRLTYIYSSYADTRRSLM